MYSHRRTPANDAPEHIRFFLLEDFTHLAFSSALEPLRLANLISGKALYTWSLASVDGIRARYGLGRARFGAGSPRGAQRAYLKPCA